ncbi:alpha/beta hydrolase family esterase [Cribrihabitans neustonicus]|uniref:alpha/beta hydrolase family esterase n=1 Tax=Cribrihabitans neustonicus TaxID=1429085 RepID=UPI003B5C4678
MDRGSYRILLPDGHEPGAKAPVVMFLHGYGGSSAQILGNRSLAEGLTARGFALIAPEGSLRGSAAGGAGSGRRSWVFGPFWQGRDEAAFFAEVLEDAAARFGTSLRRTVLAGFSSGAFMVHYLACEHPEAFAAYAPVSGAFWRPQPEACAGPVRLLHSHGWSDGVVPLEGRVLGGGRFVQGDAFAALELWRQTNGCASHAPAQSWRAAGVLRRRWDCAPGAEIGLVLFEGGHRIPDAWPGWLADWLAEAGALR